MLKGRSINFLDNIIILKHGNGRHDGMNVLRRILMVFENTTNKCSRGVPPSALAIPLVGLSQDAPTTTGWCFCVVEFKLFNGCDTCPEIMRISTIIHLGSEQQRPTQHIRRRPPSRCSCWPFAGVDGSGGGHKHKPTNDASQPTDRQFDHSTDPPAPT